MDSNQPPGTTPPTPPQSPRSVTPPPLTPPMIQSGHRAHPPKSGRGWMVVAIIAILLLMVVTLVDLSKFSLPTGFAVGGSTDSYFEESTVEASKSRNKIAIIDVNGVISSYGGGGPNMVDIIKLKLKRAGKDDHVKAVILRVDSPGGEVLASDDIAMAVRQFHSKNQNKPVIASMGSVAASGGYYVAAPCRWIVAHPLTITGSIGVIMQGVNYRGLLDKVGVRPDTYKSGPHKDMLSGMRSPDEIPAEEKKMIQSLISETYGRFKEVVKDGRETAFRMNKMHGFAEDAKELGNQWEELADGRVFSGKTAFENGYVDELGGLDVAIKRAKTLGGVTDARVVRYQVPFDFGNIFRLLGQAKTEVKVDLGITHPEVKTGYLYFLAPSFLRR